MGFEPRGKIAVVTGGAQGIGRALCRALASEGVRGLVVADVDERGAQAVAKETGGAAVRCDVSIDEHLAAAVEMARRLFGGVDLFCSNAGILVEGGVKTAAEDWDRIWRVNVLSHATAARLVVGEMIRQGGGCLLNTVSAAGLLTIPGALPYAVTKHAALGMAEWLNMTYGSRGVQVSALCPMGVRTNMMGDGSNPVSRMLLPGAVEPEQVAEVALEGIRAGRFLILPHPEVGKFFRNKATDYERWLTSMRAISDEGREEKA